MDFSPWDIADSFRLHEAACLIAGVMPLSKRFPDADEIPAAAKPVLKKLSVGYYFGTMLDASEAIDSPQNPKEKWLFGIAADPSDVNLVWKHPRGAIRKGGTTLDMGATILSYLKHAMVSRSELHRWVKAMGIKSAYSFAPIVASHSAEPDTAPAPTTAAPAPVMAAEPAGSDSAREIAPEAPKRIESVKPLQRSAAQDLAILAKIKSLN